MELCMHEKAVLFLPVNTLMVWLPTFLATRHTTLCPFRISRIRGKQEWDENRNWEWE